MANDNPSVEEMRASFDSESVVDQSHDPELESMRSEITGESAMMPENMESEPEIPLAQNVGETAFDVLAQTSSSIPLVTPISDAALAAGYTGYNLLKDPSLDVVGEFGQQFGNVMSAREALSGQAQKRSPTASFLSSVPTSMAIPAGGAGASGRIAYESALAGIDALLRGRSPLQTGGEAFTAGGFQAIASAVPWLRGIFPATSLTPDIVNKAAARASSWFTPSSKLDASDIADLYGDVEGRRQVRAYEKGELLRRSGEQGPQLSLIEATKEVADELQSAFQGMQREMGGKYAGLKTKFVSPASYQDFMTSIDGIAEIENLSKVIYDKPHLFSPEMKRVVKDSLEKFHKGIVSEYGSLKNAKTFKEVQESSLPIINRLKQRFDKAKTGLERDKISLELNKLYIKHQVQLKKATRLSKEALISFKQDMDNLTKSISKSSDPNIFVKRADDIRLINEMRNSASRMLGKDFIKSEDLTNANVDYSRFQEGMSDIFDHLAKTGAARKGDLRRGTVDPYKLHRGISTQGIEASDKFWSGINKVKDYITTDDKKIMEVVEKSGIKPAFARMKQLVDVMAKKQQLFKASTAGGPSSMGMHEATKGLILSSGDKNKVAFAMLTAPISNPYGWANMVDHFADAFSTKQNKVNTKALEKWWGKAGRKLIDVWPVHPVSSTGIPTGPRELMYKIAEDPATAITKGIVRPTKYMTMPKGDKFVGFDPANTQLLKPFPWSEEVDETAVMPENVESTTTEKKNERKI